MFSVSSYLKALYKFVIIIISIIIIIRCNSVVFVMNVDGVISLKIAQQYLF